MDHFNTLERPGSLLTGSSLTASPAADSTVPDSSFAATPATSAKRLASANRAANLAALAATQPRLAGSAPPVPAGVRFVFGRDGCLTAFDAGGRWWSGCSLPRRAAGAMLRNLELQGVVGCLLPPPHAASVRASLGKAGPRQAVIVLVPGPAESAVLLACDDFSAEIRRHRLWFAWGPEWQAELGRLFDEQPGLPTPSQFIRVPIGDPAAGEPVLAAAQKALAEAGSRRAEAIRAARERWPAPARSAAGSHPPRLCVVGGRDFRLWDDAAFSLAAALTGGASRAARCAVVCPDDPASASPLALLSAAAGCDALVTADTARADLPGLLPEELPWLTWVTTPRLPPFAGAGPRDALLVADPAWRRRALEAGWPAGRVGVARWPELTGAWESGPGGTEPLHGSEPALGLIADTADPEPPERLDQFSSHRLLWDSIREELEADPLRLAGPGADPAAYLEERRRACEVAPESLDRGLFLEGLIFPGYARSLARLLLAGGLPLRLFGKGWDRIGEFAPHAAGPVNSRAALARAVAGSAALVRAWPTRHAHPIEAAGKPVIGPAGREPGPLLRAAAWVLKTGQRPPGERVEGERVEGERLSLRRLLDAVGGLAGPRGAAWG